MACFTVIEQTYNIVYILLVVHHSCCPHCFPLGTGPPLGCRAEIRTRACRTASRRATIWATPHPNALTTPLLLFLLYFALPRLLVFLHLSSRFLLFILYLALSFCTYHLLSPFLLLYLISPSHSFIISSFLFPLSFLLHQSSQFHSCSFFALFYFIYILVLSTPLLIFCLFFFVQLLILVLSTPLLISCLFFFV